MKDRVAITGLGWFILASVSLAAQPGTPVLNPGRLLLEQIRRQTPFAPSQHLAPKTANQPGIPNPKETKVFIGKIEILGATKIPHDQLSAIAARYERRPLGISDINVLMETLTRAYVNRGYITTRVYLPEQNLAGGILKLQVLEGRLASFSTGTLKKSQLFSAFPTQPGDIVRLPDLEQGMDQLERATSMQVKSELLPGPKGEQRTAHLKPHKR